jgi:hypothetical protein
MAFVLDTTKRAGTEGVNATGGSTTTLAAKGTAAFITGEVK